MIRPVNGDSDSTPGGLWRRRSERLGGALREELLNAQPLSLVAAMLKILPVHVGCRVRVRVLRAAGMSISRSATLTDVPIMHGPRSVRKRLTIGNDVFINIRCVFDLTNTITIGDGAAIGHEVMLLTSSHEVGPRQQRAGSLFSAPITIGAGAWIGARVTILPGVTIGPGAVVGAGAMVTADVPANSLSVGVPAATKVMLDHRLVRSATHDEAS